MAETAIGKPFEVYASKTEAEAKALASQGHEGAVCFTTDKKSIVFNGENYGGDQLTDWQKEYLQQKEQEEMEAKYAVAVSISPSATFVKGTNTEVTTTVTVTYGGAAVDPTVLKGTGALASLDNISKFTKTATGKYTAKVTVNAAATFGVQATYQGFTKSAQKSIQAYYRIRYGVNGNASCGPSDIAALASTKGPQASAAGEYVFTFTANTYAWLCIPEGVTIPASLNGSNPQGTEGPLPVFFTKTGTVEGSDGISYTVFRIADMQAASTHTIKFS